MLFAVYADYTRLLYRVRDSTNQLPRAMFTPRATYTIRFLVCPLSPYSQTSPHNSELDPSYVHMTIATLACHRAHRKPPALRPRFLRRQSRAASVTPSHAERSQRHDRAQEHAQTRRTSRTRSCEVQRAAAGERRARTSNSRRCSSSPRRPPPGQPGQRPSW